MTLKEHQEISIKTWHKKNVDKKTRINHAILGMFDEIGEISSCLKKQVGYGQELDVVNIKEELGDYMYFLERFVEESNLFNCKDLHNFIEKKSLSKKDMIGSVCDLSISNASLIWCFLNNLKSESYRDILDINLSLNRIMDLNDLTFSDVLESNIAKLKARYGDRLEFTEEKALNRDLEVERDVLSGN